MVSSYVWCEFAQKQTKNPYMIRWFAALIGYMFFRIPGALLGFFLGVAFDQMSGSSRFQMRSISPQEFELNLLALAAVVIKADGKVEEKELQFVRNYFISQYGPERAKSIFKHFNTAVKQKAQQVGTLTQYFVSQVRYETRLQILHFLFAIANADGKISPVEVEKIEQIAMGLNLRRPDIESIKAMFFKSSDTAYKILELSPKATTAEIKQAYRKMVKKYHPDRLQTKDEALKKGAQEKFRQVQQAYETLKKERQF